MTPEQIMALATDFIASLGFPIFVAVYLLIYQKRTLEKLTDAINHLSEMVEVLITREKSPH